MVGFSDSPNKAPKHLGRAKASGLTRLPLGKVWELLSHCKQMFASTGYWSGSPSSTSSLLKSTLEKCFASLSFCLFFFSFDYRDNSSAYLLEHCEKRMLIAHLTLLAQQWAHVHYQYTLVIWTYYLTFEFGVTEGSGDSLGSIDESLNKESGFEELPKALR